jgi:mannose-1-phosphate guanylyltransferase
MIDKKIVAIILAAGFGTRLLPLTLKWPKCLMPIRNRPLLEHWLSMLFTAGVKRVLVNTHHRALDVRAFLGRKMFTDWVTEAYEPILLGTSGTIRNNKHFISNSDLLLIHGDNWCQCNLQQFIEYHINHRPIETLITMMIFETKNPMGCGIVELNDKGVVVGFHEKVTNPPGNLANAAIYMLSNEVVNWIIQNPNANDFSTEVIPKFIGKIATWKNKEILRDIGSIKELIKSQSDSAPPALWDQNDDWCKFFFNSEAFIEINKSLNANIAVK